MNWKNQLGKIIDDGRMNHTCFYQEKRVEYDEDKKQVKFTQSNFPNFLKTQQKQAIKQKNQTCAKKARNKADLIPSGFPSAP